MATNLSALKDAIKMLADFGLDTRELVKDGPGLIGAMMDYKNLVADLSALIPEIGDIPSEAKALTPEDYVSLVSALVADLGLTEGRTGSLITAGMDLLAALASIAPAVENFVNVIKA